MTPIDNADDLINSLMDQIEKLAKTAEINTRDHEWDEMYCKWYTCPNCRSNNVAGGWNFCPKCGAKVKWIKEERSED